MRSIHGAKFFIGGAYEAIHGVKFFIGALGGIDGEEKEEGVRKGEFEVQNSKFKVVEHLRCK